MSHPSIMEQLRAATARRHGAVEALPFAMALVAGALPAASYAGFVRAMLTIHAALEGELARAAHPLLRAVWAPELARLDLLEADARFWAGEPEIAEAQVQAQVLADKLRRRAAADPASLLGALYVLVGSTLGGAVVRRHVVRAYGLRGAEGVAYLAGAGLKARWRRFGERMDAALVEADAQQAALAAADETFAGIGAVVAALHPLGERAPADPLAALNPEAGAHAIPGDLREIEAALRAGARSWADCPYYAMRYGERGER
ncbi:MAG TPA: biliverdin-producing heme oxygenase, partial [Herpetosiphonaceae bacterium]